MLITTLLVAFAGLLTLWVLVLLFCKLEAHRWNVPTALAMSPRCRRIVTVLLVAGSLLASCGVWVSWMAAAGTIIVDGTLLYVMLKHW